MKNVLQSGCLIILLTLIPSTGRTDFESWSAGESPGGISCRDIITFPDDTGYRVLCALEPGTSSGIHRSTDQGETWLPSISGAPQGVIIADLEYIPDSQPFILAAAFQGSPPGEGGVYRSEDDGETWQQFSNGFPSADIRAVLADPFDTNRLFAGAVFDGVFISTDRGENWTASNAGLTNLRVQVLIADPSIENLLYCGSLIGLHRSTDSGATWELLTLPHATPQIVTAIVLSHIPGSILVSYRVSSVNYLVRSTNSGETWQAIDSGLPSDKQVRSLLMNPDRPGHLYCGTVYDGIFRSTMGGTNWFNFSDGLPMGEFFTVSCIGHATSVSGDSCRLFAGTNYVGSVFLRDDALPTPTATLPPTVTPTPTRTPSPSQTAGPSHTPTPAPSTSPTPTPYSFGIALELPASHFNEGELFELTLRRTNPYSDSFMYPVFIVLDVASHYWFWPSWRQYDQTTHTGLDYNLVSFPPGVNDLNVIPAFEWPNNTGSAEGLVFWSCIMDPNLVYIIGELIWIEFGYSA